MPKRDKQTQGELDERYTNQMAILKKYGRRELNKAEDRLCIPCYRYGHCSLYPLTMDGADCPYQTGADPDTVT